VKDIPWKNVNGSKATRAILPPHRIIHTTGPLQGLSLYGRGKGGQDGVKESKAWRERTLKEVEKKRVGRVAERERERERENKEVDERGQERKERDD
jgi:hypothetical protein